MCVVQCYESLTKLRVKNERIIALIPRYSVTFSKFAISLQIKQFNKIISLQQNQKPYVKVRPSTATLHFSCNVCTVQC